uniref:RNase H type-1 domain-containing protein n=1 Tax=Chenopodium quinoa TaxID=63459 RepID=A0A803LJD2_CHEQI
MGCAKYVAARRRALFMPFFFVRRNSIVFEEPWQNGEVGVLGFVKLFHDYSGHMKAVSCVMGRAGGVSRSSWVLPAAGVARIILDAAVFDGRGVGLAAVIRDWRGAILAMIVRRLQAQMQVSMAEALASRLGVSVARRLGFDRVELECDASTVVNAINNNRSGRASIDLIF